MLVKVQLNTMLTFVPLSSSAPVVWIIQILVCPRNSTEILVCPLALLLVVSTSLGLPEVQVLLSLNITIIL